MFFILIFFRFFRFSGDYQGSCAFFCLAAGLALTGEGELTFADHAAGSVFDCAAQLLGNLHLGKIHDSGAVRTDEVDMGFYVGIEPFDAVHGGHALDQPLLLEQGDVAVDRPKGQVRDLGLQRGVHRLSRRMQVGGPQVS